VRDGYYARWQGQEYEAAPDGEKIRLYATATAEGFEEVSQGRYRRIVPADDADECVYIRTTCRWRDAPFIILGEHADWLRLEYTGGKAPTAQELALEEFDFGVYQGWAPRSEVTDVREQRI